MTPLWNLQSLRWAAWGLLLPLLGCSTLPTSCPDPHALHAEHLHGRWTVQLDGTPWDLQLGPHPEHAGSLRGELRRGPLRYPVAADLDSGEFTLEESHDGQRIAATWQGTLAPDTCGKTLTGQRQTEHSPAQPFVMQRPPSP